MLRSILSSFARAYGRGMGRSAARQTAWLAIPILIAVVFLGFTELDELQNLFEGVGRLMAHWGL